MSFKDKLRTTFNSASMFVGLGGLIAFPLLLYQAGFNPLLSLVGGVFSWKAASIYYVLLKELKKVRWE